MNIQITADHVTIEASTSSDVNVLLTAVDESELLNQFSVEERLDSLDTSDIVDYLANLAKDDE